jgi:hypothetical protein
MDLFALRESIVLEQRLDVLPARQSANSADIRHIDYLCQTAPRSIAEDRPFHMRGLHLPARHSKLAMLVDESLSDVDRLAVALGETEGDVDLVLCGSFADFLHFGTVDFERVLDVLDVQFEVYWPAPARLVSREIEWRSGKRPYPSGIAVESRVSKTPKRGVKGQGV